MNGSAVESLAEVFKCCICFEKLKNAHLCPHCSKPCCYACILRWLETAKQCPYCRVTLHVRNLINCRWVEDVTQQLDTLQQSREDAKKEMCIAHNEKISVFCVNCEQCICHHCALWDDIHFNHVLKPLEEVYLQHAKKVDEDLICLRKRHSEVKGVIKRMDKIVKDLTYAKNERVEEIKNFASQAILRLEEQLQKKLSSLVKEKNLLSEEFSKIESILESSEKERRTSLKSELVITSKRITHSISELKCQPITNFMNLYATIDKKFPSEIIPPYEGSTFIIPNFSVLLLKGDPIYSPPLKACGLVWRLKVYADGGENYLSVYFELYSGFPGTSKYQYKVEMINLRPGDSSKIIQEFTSEFDVGKCWGFNRFYLLDELARDGYLIEDKLVLKFRVRSSSYHQKSRVQEWYNNQLLTKINTLRKQKYYFLKR